MKEIWVSKSYMVEKPWGFEQTWGTGGNGYIAGKILHIKKGFRNSLKYNQIKDETLFVLSGKLLLTYANEQFQEHKEFCSRYILPGETLNIQSGCPYRFKAVEDSVVVEIGSRVQVPNEVVRFHDDYGRHNSSADQFVHSLAQQSEDGIESSE